MNSQSKSQQPENSRYLSPPTGDVAKFPYSFGGDLFLYLFIQVHREFRFIDA